MITHLFFSSWTQLSLSRWSICLLCFILTLTAQGSAEVSERSARTVMADLMLAERSEQAGLIDELSTFGDTIIADVYEAWRTGGIFLLEQDSGDQLLQFTSAQQWELVATGAVVSLTEAEALAANKQRPARALRKQMKRIIDTLGLKAEDPSLRIDSAIKLGRSQKSEFIPALQARLLIEPTEEVQAALKEALAISWLANGDASQVVQAVDTLKELRSVAARAFLEEVLEKERNSERADSALSTACTEALAAIESYIKKQEFFGSFFRGFSTGSVLLIVSFGLAITFGLMGVINMAHGEFVAIGGYVTFLVQNVFINTFGLSSSAFGWYLIVALPASFLVAAAIGLVMEKSIIRFLYRRPLESLLCTWGISMVMQQGFRLIFGAANVQVNNPTWLMGNWSFAGFQMSYTRLLIIAIALIVVALTWLLLRQTNLGLHIRAVMQNRHMASGLGIPVARVNTMTFALGCGLAAIGGAVLSQIGNVGPSMGQAYIVDSFMVVVTGSVGNLLGAGLSAMGIGLVDQLLQPSLGPVMGKITVFMVIILFLQWRPGGLFPTRSRSLDD
ncbi:MAG: urea ABC transporter permease subunit UrtB [Puniceicoccaceae bacterium MED-G31]|nr:MAG: urea ABC transporter permease subunit UrtB [Puniceicoccaceae bacterium MED-G31]